MPVSVVVGGQYGSEGKGKVALHFAKEFGVKAVVKVSGTNSGHTVYDASGEKHILRVLPSACVLPDVMLVISAGAYFQPDLLLKECEEMHLDMSRLFIHPNAGIITHEIEQEEKWTDLKERIGSTTSGTGSATVHRILDDGKFVRACEVAELDNYLMDTTWLMREWLNVDEHILIEGGQGFGLSLYHTRYYPYCTSRDTTASAFVGDAGLSPLDVENVIQVLRTYEIRVAGNSGPMSCETTWETVTQRANSPYPIQEYTSVSQRLRRVGYFDYKLVAQAVQVNRPNITVMNFMDYIGEEGVPYDSREMGPNRRKFLQDVEELTGCKVTHVGFSGTDVHLV